MVKKVIKVFGKEMRRSLLVAFVGDFSFLVALAWRDVISEWVKTLTSVSPVQGQVAVAIFTTNIAVLGIIIATRIFAEKEVEASKK